MIPSRRAYGLLFLGVAIAALLSVLPIPELARELRLAIAIFVTLLFDVVVLILIGIDGLYTRPHRVKIQRLPLHRLSIGRENAVTLTLRSGKRPATVLLRDGYPADFPVTPPLLRAALSANANQEVTYTVVPNQRGEFQWGKLRSRQLGNWGLAWHQWTVDLTETVAVYPDLVGLRSLSIRLALQSTGNLRQARRLGIGTEFAELRHYTVGDDPRLIDWKATARRGSTQMANRSPLLVRVLEPEQEQTLLILLDRGRLMTAQVEGLKRFDWGLNATLSLALAGLNRGDRVGVAVFDRQVTTWIPPERGQQHLPRLIERLTPIQPVLLEPDYIGAVTNLVRHQSRRALVVLIADIVDTTASEELLSAMSRLSPRYLPFCVALRDPQVDRQAHATTLDVGTSYARAVALDLLAQRQVAFGRLKQRGVLVLDAPASQISTQIVDRYLQLKSRNQL